MSSQPADTPPNDGGVSEYRPSDRFWPYVDVAEEPSDEELALLDPDLREVLLGHTSDRSFSVTLVFSPFDGPDYERAVELARASTEYRVTGSASAMRHRARFLHGAGSPSGSRLPGGVGLPGGTALRRWTIFRQILPGSRRRYVEQLRFFLNIG